MATPAQQEEVVTEGLVGLIPAILPEAVLHMAGVVIAEEEVITEEADIAEVAVIMVAQLHISVNNEIKNVQSEVGI